jgi:DNA-binding HxlR family transcriptional regulator
VVGDRWTLLIVRELLTGPRRFGELQAGLPGIATNLLANRLRQMEDSGLLGRSLGEPGMGVRYALSSRGEELREAIEALLRWSVPLMVSGRGDQEVRSSWLVVALPGLLRARPRHRVHVAVTVCGEDLLLTGDTKGIRVTLGRGEAVDAEIVAEPEVILGLAAGALSLRSARQKGATIRGNASALASVFESTSSAARMLRGKTSSARTVRTRLGRQER